MPSPATDSDPYRRALAHPGDPQPLVELGLSALLRGAVDEASCYFDDALRQDVSHAGARWGAALVDYVRSGSEAPLRRLAAGDPTTLTTLPAPIAGWVAGLLQRPEPLLGVAARTPPTGLASLRARNLSAEFRARELRGEAPPPPVGRRSLIRALLRATEAPTGKTVVFLGRHHVSLEAVCDAVLPSFAEAHSRATAGGTLWELVGDLPKNLAAESFEARLEQLRAERADGHLLFHRHLLETIGALGLARSTALLRAGILVTALHENELERLLSQGPGLRADLVTIPVEAILPAEAMAALAKDRSALELWLGAPLPAEDVREVVELAEHFVSDLALPESAMMVLNETRGSGPGAPATAEALDKSLRAAALRAAQLSPTCIFGRGTFTGTDIANEVFERVGSHRNACDTIGRVLAPVCAFRGLKPRRYLPDGAFLFVGPAGVGKRTMARALASALYGEDAFLLVDLALHGENAAGVIEISGVSKGPALVDSFFRRRPFGVVYFDHVDHASPQMLSLLTQTLESGRLAGERTIPSLHHAIFILSLDGQSDRREMGFSAPEGDMGWIRERYFSATPGLLHTLTCVSFAPLRDQEYADVIRRRLDHVVVKRMAGERHLRLRYDATALQHLAREAKTSGLGAERVQELIEEQVLAPLWLMLDDGFQSGTLTAEQGALRWVRDAAIEGAAGFAGSPGSAGPADSAGAA